MNERIKQLAEQAGYSWHNQFSGPILSSRATEKFAELIIKECAMFVVTELEGKVGSLIADTTANRLEQHFGVEQ